MTLHANGNQLTQTDPVEIRWNNTTGVANPNILMRFAASEHTTRMSYDSANRLTSTNNALSTPSDPRVWTREYDAAGRLIARTDANGTRITQTYNADGQLASIDYPNGKRVTYDWTCCRMASMCDDYGRSRFTYDVANRLVSAVDATGHVVLNRYDAAGRRAALTLPDGSGYAYTYDVYGQIASIVGANGNSSWVRDDARRLALIDFGPPLGGAQPNEVNYTWTPTALQRTVGVIDTGIPANIFRENFTLVDPQMPGASPLDVIESILPSVTEDLLTVRRDLRVIRDEHTGGTPAMDLTYTYDPAGNRTGREDLLATPVNLDYEYFNAANQLVGQKPVQGTTPLEIIGNMIEIAHEPNNITVDKNGNITKIDYYQMVYVDADPGVPVDPEWQRLLTFTWNFRFDYENRLIEARGTQIAIPNALDPDNDDPAPIEAAYFNYEFGYDGLGRRVWTQENSGNGSWFIYDGDQLVQERDFRSDALIVEYAWGPTTGAPAIFYQKRIVADVPKEHWIYTSPQGGFPRHLFDDTGAITDTFQYSSFGELVFHEGSTEVSMINSALWNFDLNQGLSLTIALTNNGSAKLVKLALTVNIGVSVLASPASGGEICIKTRPMGGGGTDTSDTCENDLCGASSCCGKEYALEGGCPFGGNGRPYITPSDACTKDVSFDAIRETAKCLGYICTTVGGSKPLPRKCLAWVEGTRPEDRTDDLCTKWSETWTDHRIGISLQDRGMAEKAMTCLMLAESAGNPGAENAGVGCYQMESNFRDKCFDEVREKVLAGQTCSASLTNEWNSWVANIKSRTRPPLDCSAANLSREDKTSCAFEIARSPFFSALCAYRDLCYAGQNAINVGRWYRAWASCDDRVKEGKGPVFDCCLNCCEPDQMPHFKP